MDRTNISPQRAALAQPHILEACTHIVPTMMELSHTNITYFNAINSLKSDKVSKSFIEENVIEIKCTDNKCKGYLFGIGFQSKEHFRVLANGFDNSYYNYMSCLQIIIDYKDDCYEHLASADSVNKKSA
uniref:Retrovirus-related Pol polyprotein from transposon TNT 1-94 n=1 Tax=Rhabditophanes sp. KR3021 TaxID=114890 RepID=A0AC35U812_9BILA